MPTDTVKPAAPAAPVSAKPAVKPAVSAKPPRAAALKASVAKPAVAKAAPIAAPVQAAKPAQLKSAPAAKAPVVAAPVLAVKAPVAARPVVAEPVVAKSVAAKSVAAKPVVAKPVAAKPAPAKPAATAAAAPAKPQLPAAAHAAKVATPVAPAPVAKAPVAKAPLAKAPVAPVAKPAPAPALSAPVVLPVADLSKVAASVGEVLPKAINDIASTGLNQAREGYATLKDSAEALSAGFETGTQAAARGVQDFSKTLIDAIQANTDATLGFLKALTGVRTMSEAIEIQSSHARRQFETVSSQAKTLAGIAQRTATETTEPVRKAFDKTLRRSA